MRLVSLIPHYYNARMMSEAEVARMRGLYDGELLWLDGQLDRLFRRFDELGLLDETLFLITADHGEAVHDRGLTGHNLSLDEWEVHEPFWIRMPGLAAGAAGQAAIREGCFKLLRASDGNAKLADLASEAALDLSAEQPELRDRLLERLESWLAEQKKRLDSDQQISEEVKDKLRGLGYLD